mmetsp:Transcript_57672/g.172079  ORF Transcript_57672/g.172079 Transcript_57672/m.172079 type:complete len:299 (-) Transcript_57672:76-972(-)
MSCSSSHAFPTLSCHLGSITTWHVLHAMMPLHAHSMYSPSVDAPDDVPNLATSVMDVPSSASTSKARVIMTSRSSSPSSSSGFGALPPSFSVSPESQALGGTTQNFTVDFPSRAASCCLTDPARASRPSSSPTSHRPAMERIVDRSASPLIPDSRRAATMPSARSGSYPTVRRNVRALSSGVSSQGVEDRAKVLRAGAGIRRIVVEGRDDGRCGGDGEDEDDHARVPARTAEVSFPKREDPPKPTADRDEDEAPPHTPKRDGEGALPRRRIRFRTTVARAAVIFADRQWYHSSVGLWT